MTMTPTPKNTTATNGTNDPRSASMVLGSDAYRGALEPGTTAEAWNIAEMMASIGYCGVTSAPEALGRIMTGRGLGLSAMQSMRGIYTVHGRPGIDAALMQALCLQSPLCDFFDFVPEESDATKATYVAKRKGRPEVKHTFTIEDAEKMGVVEREDSKKTADSNWSKQRKAMLRARSKSELARIVFPDLIFGMYSREEIEAGLGDSTPRDPNELVGDILSNEEAAAERLSGTVQAARRDYAAEAEALKAKIRSAGTSRAAAAEVRAAIEAWDGVEPWKAAVAATYNEVREERKKAAAAVSTATPTADAPAATPALVPEAGLFAGTTTPKDESK